MEPTYIAGTTDWLSIVSLLLNLILGSGFIVSIVTLRAQRKQADAVAKGAEATAKGTEAQAETTEIENVDKVAKMWREYAEISETRYQNTIGKMSAEMTSMSSRMGEMECTIKKLNSTNNQILKILKDINHDNLEQKKQEAKDIAGA